jgi:hypothetical protein
MICAQCSNETLNREARFCSKCGGPFPARRAGVAHWIAAPFVLIGRLLAYPIKLRGEHIRWLAEASGPDSAINHVPRLSENAKRVYVYLADVTLRFGSSHSRVRTIAHVAHISKYKARKAIRELERRGLLSHKRRNTWHSRGANDYKVKPVDERKIF